MCVCETGKERERERENEFNTGWGFNIYIVDWWLSPAEPEAGSGLEWR